MAAGSGQVVEIRAGGGAGEPDAVTSAFIACEPALVPAPGEYLMAAPVQESARAGEGEPALAAAVFLGPTPPGPRQDLPPGFWASAPLPRGWLPGTRLHLRGPSGSGFHLPSGARRVALVNLGDAPGPLLALAEMALQRDCPVVYFGDPEMAPVLPPAVEAYPLDGLMEMGDWAEYLAVALPPGSIPDLSEIPGLAAGSRKGFPFEALVRIPMPCGGLGDCGVCAIPRGREWLLACVDGPVIQFSPAS